MENGLILCAGCRRQQSVIAGTVFQDSHMPLPTWLRAMWHVCANKNGMSAQNLQRLLGLRSYNTAWLCLHKLRRAMVRPGRERLSGIVEADETYVGGPREGQRERGAFGKQIVFIAAEVRGRKVGRIRLSHSLQDYLNEFTFRFNRRNAKNRGLLFYRLAQLAVVTAPNPRSTIVPPQDVVAG